MAPVLNKMKHFVSQQIVSFLFLVSGLGGPSLDAKDLAVVGSLFPIEEADLLESLKHKVKNLSKEELSAMQKKIQQAALAVQTPPSIKGLKEAKSYRLSYFDPTLCTDQDIKDQQGKVLVLKGTCTNPLETIFHLEPLLFLDGSNLFHLEWAKTQPSPAKWVLIKGKPLQLEEQEERPIYFDQGGFLVQKFGILHVPAKVSQEGRRLKIEEFPLRG